jgi:hypothetical protein
MSTPLELAAYQPHVNTTFTVHGPRGTQPVTLTSAKSKIDDEIQCCFVLHFAGAGEALPQGIYRLSHQALGELEMFIVPIQSRKPGVLYEAGFNLLKDEVSS